MDGQLYILGKGKERRMNQNILKLRRNVKYLLKIYHSSPGGFSPQIHSEFFWFWVCDSLGLTVLAIELKFGISSSNYNYFIRKNTTFLWNLSNAKLKFGIIFLRRRQIILQLQHIIPKTKNFVMNIEEENLRELEKKNKNKKKT